MGGAEPYILGGKEIKGTESDFEILELLLKQYPSVTDIVMDEATLISKLYP